jgi:hypothetical protein
MQEVNILDKNLIFKGKNYHILHDSEYTMGSNWKWVLTDTKYSYLQLFTNNHNHSQSVRNSCFVRRILCHHRPPPGFRFPRHILCDWEAAQITRIMITCMLHYIIFSWATKAMLILPAPHLLWLWDVSVTQQMHGLFCDIPVVTKF